MLEYASCVWDPYVDKNINTYFRNGAKKSNTIGHIKEKWYKYYIFLRRSLMAITFTSRYQDLNYFIRQSIMHQD